MKPFLITFSNKKWQLGQLIPEIWNYHSKDLISMCFKMSGTSTDLCSEDLSDQL